MQEAIKSTETPKTQPGGDDEVIQLRYQNDEENLVDLAADDLAEVLEALDSLTKDLAKSGAFGSEFPPELRVLPPKQGSFLLEAVLTWAQANPGEAFAVGVPAAGGTVTGLVKAIQMMIKSLRVKVSDFEYLEGGEKVKVIWQDNTAEEIPIAVWQEFNKRKGKHRKDMRKLLAPLGDNADRLEIRSGNEATVASAPIQVIATRTEYSIVAREIDEVEESTEEFETEAQVTALDFDGQGSWRVRTPTMQRKAAMEDLEFMRKLDQGLTVSKGDIFRLKMRLDTQTRNGRTSTSLAIVEVLSQRRGDPDDHDNAQVGNEDHSSDEAGDGLVDPAAEH